MSNDLLRTASLFLLSVMRGALALLLSAEKGLSGEDTIRRWHSRLMTFFAITLPFTVSLNSL